VFALVVSPVALLNVVFFVVPKFVLVYTY